MTLGEYHQMVADSLRRGTTLSTQIVQQTELAVQWLERNYTFPYMETFRLFQLVKGSRTLDLPTNAVIKSYKFLRLVREDGAYVPLRRVEPEDLKGLRTRGHDLIPAAFWTVGNSTIVFDCNIGEDVSGEAMYHQYSAWPKGADETHALLGFASDVLLYQTLLLMAGFLKDGEMMQGYKVLRDEAINTLSRAEDENKYSGQSFSMGYSGQ